MNTTNRKGGRARRRNHGRAHRRASRQRRNPLLLLDIVPRELTAEEKRKGLTLESPAVRNRIVLAGLEAAKKSRPAAFFTPKPRG